MLFLKSILIKIIKNNQNFFHRRYVVVPQKAMADGNLRHSGRMWRMVFSTHRKTLAHTEFNNDSKRCFSPKRNKGAHSLICKQISFKILKIDIYFFFLL